MVRTTRETHWLHLLLLTGVIAAVFWPVLGFDFVRWDDDINITQNPLLTQPWSWSLVREFFGAEQALRFKPLHWLFDRGLYAVFGFDPRAWHAFNLVLHTLAALVLYRVALDALALRVRTEHSARVRWAAFFVAALWALHPLRAETVAWATASPYPLTTLCLLLSFRFYLKAHENPGARGTLFWSWLFAVAGYASYPVGITYGLWLIAVDRWLLPREATNKALWQADGNVAWCLKHAVFLAPAAVAVAITLWTRFNAPGIFGDAPAVASVDLWTRWRMAAAALAYLVLRFFAPVDLTPNVSPLADNRAVILEVAALGLFSIAGLIAAWRTRGRSPGVALVCFGFAALALPCLGWTERPSWPVDRYSYLAHLVLVSGLVGGCLWWTERKGGPAFLLGFLGAGGVLVFGVFARKQAMIWRDSTALFTHMEQHPAFAENPRQQAHVYILWAHREGAEGHAEAANALFEKSRQVYLAAMRTAVSQQNYAEALSLLTHWQRYFGLSPQMRREKGAWLLQARQVPEALRELRAAQTELPGDARVESLLQDAERELQGAVTGTR
jgi:protein O-mannosyl-transferase